MTVLLGGPAPTTDALWVSNAARVTDTGALAWSILNTATLGYLCYLPADAAPAQRWQITGKLTAPTGPAVQLQVQVLAIAAPSTILASTSSATLTATAAGTDFSLVSSSLPAGTTSVRVQVNLMDNATGTSRTFTVSNLTASPAAYPLEIIAAPLSRPLRRTVLDVTNDDDYRVNYGTPGKLAGSVTYLCDTFTDAAALDALYQTTAVVTLTSDDELNGLRHLAVGDIRYSTEKALPGRPCKWTVQVEIREAS